ncbi:hypothetical protein HDU96_005873 [Phlyctochytrium bullatum]|nr:hypothetical protein HDU96_005873 [Phlyctochytrium bullatum]
MTSRCWLFTVYSDSGAESGMARKLDFTCCDFEAEIVARNVLLLSMIVDGDVDHDVMWNIYYDLKLDDVSLQALCKQAQKLLNVAQTTDSWRNSSYGKVIRFCDASTLERMVPLWKIYAINPSDPTGLAKQQKTLKARFDEAMETRRARLGNATILTGLRSSSPCELVALKEVPELSKSYWKSGLTTSLPERISRAKHFNPMYATSSEHIVLHYALDPVVGYHLSTAVAELDKASEFRPPGTSNVVEKYTSAAKLQFSAWVKAFRAVMSRVIVRYSFSDALAFSHVLQYQHTHGNCVGAGWYRNSFTFDALILDPVEYAPESETAAPTTFNVIDTSNLVDHLGCLNLIAAAGPLLKPDPSSTLFTEILVKHGKPLDEILEFLLTGDFTVMALLLGLTPLEIWTGATGVGRTGVAIEGLVNQGAVGQSWFKMGWRPREQDEIEWDVAELTDVFVNMYRDMFRDENERHGSSIESLPTHTRASLVTVLQAVKNVNAFDWDAFIRGFLERVTADRSLPIGPRYFHELFVQLHICGLLPNFPLASSLGLGGSNYPGPNKGPLANWQPLPPVICVTLLVSRWNGSSPLIVSTIVPSQFISEKAGLGMKICFQLRSSFGTLLQFERYFGQSLVIQRSTLASRDVFITRHRPNLNSYLVTCALPRTPGQPAAGMEETGAAVKVSLDAERYSVALLTFRLNVLGQKSRALLASGAQVDVTQPTSFTVRFQCGGPTGFQRTLSSPLPLEMKRTKVAIARKSGYISFTAPIADQASLRCRPDCIFPVTVDGNGKLHLQTLHRINPALAPVLNVSAGNKWLDPHVATSITDAERAEIDMARVSGGEPADLRCRLKESIHIMFVRYAGVQGGGKVPAFYLQCQAQGGINVALLMSALRLDAGNRTVMLDAAAIPLSMSNVNQVGPFLSRMQRQALVVKVNLDELTVWKHLLPAFAERCRGYPHLASCEYRTRQCFPLSTAMGDPILCSCGLGKFPSTFVEPTVPVWKDVKKFAVRVAIPGRQFIESAIDSFGYQRAVYVCVAFLEAAFMRAWSMY